MNERKMREIIREEMNNQNKKNNDKPPIWFSILLIAVVLMVIFNSGIIRFIFTLVLGAGLAYVVIKLIMYFMNRR